MLKAYDILAIDDEQVILDSIKKLCASEGYRVDTALNANEALHKLEQRSYKVIISDIMMPGMDGLQLLEIMRVRKIHIPVLMTSGYSTVEYAVKSLYYSALDFIPKPFSFEELISAVKRAQKFQHLCHREREVRDLKKSSGQVLFVPCPSTYRQLGYSTWMHRQNDGAIRIGLTDVFLKTIEKIVKVYLKNIEEELLQGTLCAQVETADGLIHNPLAPLSGRIIRVNDALPDHCEVLYKDPYFEGWLYTIVAENFDEESKLLAPCSSDGIGWC